MSNSTQPGHYFDITKPNGVRTTLFTSGDARWLRVRIGEQAEQPRVLLVSVSYALKTGGCNDRRRFASFCMRLCGAIEWRCGGIHG